MAQPKRISQETFDAVVRENIDEFEMDLDEAVADAKQQFESQGVDLSTLITTYVREPETEGSEGLRHSNPVKESLDRIKASLDTNDTKQMTEALEKFKSECSGNEERKKFATHHGALTILVSACKHLKSGPPEYLIKALEALNSLVNGQADILDKDAIKLLYGILKEYSDDSTVSEKTLKLIRLSCIKSESNRQTYVTLDIIPYLIDTLKNEKPRNASVVKEICVLLRVLTFDDDMSVPYGKAHDHAKLIVARDVFSVILNVMEDFKCDVDILSELCATLGRLFVRHEFCKEFVDIGGLKVVLKLLEENIEHQAIAKNVCAVLRAVAGNDDVKMAIVKSKGMDLIIMAMKTHEKLPFVAEQGCAALGSISLRNPENCSAIVAAGGHEAVLKAMQLHSDVVGVQKQGCLAIRNLVARNPENCEPILGAGGEVQIRYAYNKIPECTDLAKAALRDLGCDVELKELWTGQGRQLAGES